MSSMAQPSVCQYELFSILRTLAIPCNGTTDQTCLQRCGPAFIRKHCASKRFQRAEQSTIFVRAESGLFATTTLCTFRDGPF